MILYHGSTVCVRDPIIISNELGRDFGAGFYTTDIPEQAIRWAIRKARIASKLNNNAKGIVSTYNFDFDKALSKLKVKQFGEPDDIKR